MQKYIKQYINVCQSNSKNKQLSARKRIISRIEQQLVASFRNTTIKELNRERFIEILENCTENKDRVHIKNFMMYLLNEKILVDAYLNRLSDFSGYFSEKVAINDIIKVLFYDDKEYELLRDDFKSISGIMFFSIDDSCVLSEEDRHTINVYIGQIKRSKQRTVGSKLNYLFILRKIVSFLFFEKNIVEVTMNDVMNYMKDRKDSNIQVITELFCYLDTKVRLHDSMKFLVVYRDYILKSGRSVKEIIGYLEETTDVKKYICIEVKNIMHLYQTDIPYDVELRQEINLYIADGSYIKTGAFTYFIKKLFSMLGDSKLYSIVDLSYLHFRKAQVFCSSVTKNRSVLCDILVDFFIWCYEKTRINFFESSGFHVRILRSPSMCLNIEQGYSLIKYNPIEKEPLEDKWLVSYDSKYDRGSLHTSSEIYRFDFTRIKNSCFKSLAKKYVWKKNMGIKSKQKKLRNITPILNYVEDLRKGKELSIYVYSKAEDNDAFTFGEVKAVIQWINGKEYAARTIESYLADFRGFLVFLYDNKLLKLDYRIFEYLIVCNNKKNDSTAIIKDELSKLDEYLAGIRSKSMREDLFYVVFQLLIETELRVYELLNLKLDCLKETIGKKREYILEIKRKDIFEEAEEIPIPYIIANMIKHVIEVTSEVRKEVMEGEDQYLFLGYKKGYHKPGMYKPYLFNLYLEEACSKLGIAKYTAENLRDSHMTKVREHVIKNKKGASESNVLSGHGSTYVDNAHYIDKSLRSMVEAFHGVIIGDLDIDGKIVDNKKMMKEDEVSYGCGYCCSDVCMDTSYLDCLLCQYFVTMPSKLSFFDERIHALDIQIYETETKHDKEDLINIKRLLVSYKYRLLELLKGKE